MADESEKYPPKIQKLFAPRLPLLYKKPIDHPPETRASPFITLLRKWKLHIEQYKAQYGQTGPLVQHQLSAKERLAESRRRQLHEWEDTEAFAENKFLKDPYRTVFVARLYYSMTELDLSKAFAQYGSIDSVRIVRHTETGASRGYGFVVFEREADAKNCIHELAPTGLAVDPPKGSSTRRTILVDMERGRLIRSWRPRRLDGGLGGRHYTLPSALHPKDASAAASGRRFNLSQNPYQLPAAPPRFQKRPHPDRYSPAAGAKRPATDSDHYPGILRHPAMTAYASTSQPPSLSSARAPDPSVKDKYAKYQNVGSHAASGETGRSIRSIREQR
ncbi:hypothetical protein METBIDRAFT_135582 [Metschnikowia bicuspidata var. bicuspidata NRRL YB-4993]|uniref:RRM domain-containing protein n=1 Tax=Metschnikowia bicuspidata var. bicuspidata NRRL YB-4993 TaxID=869754 RepID=A0A1A0GZ81_9ASCO|nr:hypothetical protein METBIDRAFT_135582 [Metschnikowia bicuspidata var. bicuspidata NRRL YB-4993]OBA17000.1 hypothetical protein METBIDRAFT_135582 [Metschnikowia bicuspidata var. bicuspidata NRRL YB-4993]